MDGVAAVLDVEFDRLRVRRLQNVRGMGINPLTLDLVGVHASEPPRGLHVEPIEFPQDRRRHHPTLAAAQPKYSRPWQTFRPRPADLP